MDVKIVDSNFIPTKNAISKVVKIKENGRSSVRLDIVDND